MNFPQLLKLTDTLALKIKASGFQADAIVALTRGGWIPARLLSDGLGIRELLSIGLRYSDARRTDLVAYSLPDPMPTARKLLLVEDCLESGRSLQEAKRLLEAAGNEVRTASLYITRQTMTAPDYHVIAVATPPTFPWERPAPKP
ncbi:phosphoribosyltransferase [Propionivibrio dicarboxylicus]|uniref:Phosphoribosyltransferase domain-containing protein n=1 Tax=Propionivibrio dicarboxylicus TaxID=83767 RepID=A0A1G8FUY1_9RHOO|nr:phosphoribosyltransferase family protein [Propionivibrio dicarboxylicus]SDH85927.1 hypothetical protein SAMN05660652_02435 [Propionivibrio dicarboxylicus]